MLTINETTTWLLEPEVDGVPLVAEGYGDSTGRNRTRFKK